MRSFIFRISYIYINMSKRFQCGNSDMKMCTYYPCYKNEGYLFYHLYHCVLIVSYQVQLAKKWKNLDPFSALGDFSLKRAKILTWKQCWNNFQKYSEILFAHSRVIYVSLLFMTSLLCLLFFLRYWNLRIMLEATTTSRGGNGIGCSPSSPWVGIEPTLKYS